MKPLIYEKSALFLLTFFIQSATYYSLHLSFLRPVQLSQPPRWRFVWISEQPKAL